MNDIIILFVTYGGNNLGAGHIIRDLNLAKLLKSEAVIYYFANDLSSVKEIFHNYGVTTLLQGELSKLLINIKPDIMIYDRPYSLGKIEPINPLATTKIAALDYFYYDDPRVQIAINIKNHYFNSYNNIKIPQLYEGTQYAIIRDEILFYRDIRRIKKKVKNILITFGGDDPNNNTTKAINLLNTISDTQFNIKIIKSFMSKSNFDYIAKNSVHNYIIMDPTTKIGSIMNWADLAFSGAGTTMMELLSTGCPTIVIPQNENEFHLARDIANAGAIILLNYREEIHNIAAKVKNLVNDYFLLQNISSKGTILFDGKGKNRIKDIILKKQNKQPGILI
jgi:spore coat polysaccharide biosynthesis predicted glycosyltransferase SpsG